jgi:hypothetical protein
MTLLLRPATRSPPLEQLVLAKMRHAACSPRFCHRRLSPPVVAPPASSVLPFLQLGNHAPWPTAANGLWGEVNSWPPDCCGAARSTSAQSTAVSPPSFHCPRKPSALVEPPKNSLLAGNLRASGVGCYLLNHAGSSPSDCSVTIEVLRFNCRVPWLQKLPSLSMYSLRRPSPSQLSRQTPFTAYSPV